MLPVDARGLKFMISDPIMIVDQVETSETLVIVITFPESDTGAFVLQVYIDGWRSSQVRPQLLVTSHVDEALSDQELLLQVSVIVPESLVPVHTTIPVPTSNPVSAITPVSDSTHVSTSIQ